MSGPRAPMGVVLSRALLSLLGGAAVGGAVVGGAISALPSLTLAPWQWAILLLLPIAAGITALATARFTVLRSLARMP